MDLVIVNDRENDSVEFRFG